MFDFDVHISVHLDNVYVRLKVQLDAHGFICILYLTLVALHVSGAVCTHHQEHKLESTAIVMSNGYCTITITHTYGCTLQFVLLMMGANSM
jgi:hypothetical protein